MSLDYQQIKAVFSKQSLFEDKTWKLSPSPLPLTNSQAIELQLIGDACLAFYVALDNLYRKSLNKKKILRNGEIQADWVANYLNKGKSEELIQIASHKKNKGQIPPVIRPDLILTDEGWILTELDSIPGGIGLTAYLHQIYKNHSLTEDSTAVILDFYQAITPKDVKEKNGVIAILVSEEAQTYRPEMEWLAAELQQLGKEVYVINFEDIKNDDGLLFSRIKGEEKQINVIYRFWELFDRKNITNLDLIESTFLKGNVSITPPIKPHFEEKLGLALFHHHLLERFWKENISKSYLKILKQIIPKTWIIEQTDLPPTAILHAPNVDKNPINSWLQLSEASKKDRNLILKISGFDETAWGSRSVTLGNDVSKEEWSTALKKAINPANNSFYIIQEYKKPKSIEHPMFDENGSIETTTNRLRLCPYYFVHQNDNQSSKTAKLSCILATLCPSDKKIIHGMKDAMLIPCTIIYE